MRLRAAGLLAAAMIALGVGQAVTAPKPAEIVTHWQLEASFGDILPIQVTASGEGAPRTFWYMRYKITNTTGQDRVFVPEFILYTDTGELLRAGRNIPGSAFQAIKEVANDPLLLDLSDMAGRLLQGQENAKEGVAIWNDFDPSAAAFDVFVSGLSGETVELKLPKPIRVKETDAFGKQVEVVKDKIILAKTLQRHYRISVEAADRSHTALQLAEEQWVMR
ncbi:MAG: hypothetical protein MUP47_08105 [Phycisphaerae bacterium]|nr:hypothetical protein [Phycisphaerae bacterium]